jgi:Tol biopolymer transport system component
MLSLAVAIAGAAAAAWRYRTSDPGVEEARFEVAAPPGTMWAPSPVASTTQLALSPDGRQLAFVAVARRAMPQLWIRTLASIHSQPLAGTDGASFPFWSPDNRSIGFFADGKLKRIDINGGVPQVLASAPLGRGGSWNREGVIIFAPSPPSGIWRVAAAGGPVTPVTTLQPDTDATNHVWPQFLPDGRRFIFYQRSNISEHQGIFVGALDSDGTSQVIRHGGMAVVAGGSLFFVRDGTLFAQPFDDATMQPAGDPVRVADQVGFTLGTIGYSPLSAAGTTVAYGPSVRLLTGLQWRDRSGTPVGPMIARGVYRSPRLSPDGRQLVLTILDEQANSPDIWILELARGTLRRVTSDPSTDWFPVWAQDNERVFFGSARIRSTSLFQRNIAGNAPETALAGPDVARYPLDVTSDGRLVFQEGRQDGYDLGTLDLKGPRTLALLFSTPFSEVQARVAPNNRWIAYASDESGRFEVYVRGISGGGRQWTISPAGGMQPEWRRDGRELFYISRDRKLMAVPVTADADAFSAAVPSPLFDVDVPEANAPYPNDYAVSANGQRFLVNTLLDQPNGPSLAVILNWAPKSGR